MASTNTESESSESSGSGSSDDSSDGNSSDSSDDDGSNEDSDGSNEDSDESNEDSDESNEDSDESKEDSEESKVDSDDDDSDESNDEKPALPNEEQNVTREKRKAENKDTIIAFKLVKLGRGQRRERSWSSSPERGNGRAAVLSDFDSDEYEARDARPLGGSLAPYFALSRRTNTDAKGASGDASRSSASARLHCA